jgi:hypothetical protein
LKACLTRIDANEQELIIRVHLLLLKLRKTKFGRNGYGISK